jgi:site-specific recombinase XerD
MPSGIEINKELARRYDRWLTVQHYAASTRYVYSRIIRRFSEFMGRTIVTKTTHFDVREYLVTAAQRGYLPFTLSHELHALRVFFDFLNMGGLVSWVAPRFVKIRHAHSRVPKVLTEIQVRKLLEATQNKRELAIIEVLYGTGCRTGELASMRIEDVDFAAKRIRVTGKTGTRFVIFGEPASKALRSYLGKRQTGFLFASGKPYQRLRLHVTTSGGWACRWKEYDADGHVVRTKYGFLGHKNYPTYGEAFAGFRKMTRSLRLERPIGLRPLSPDSICQAVRVIGVRAGVKVTPYTLRHSFATHLLDHGADIRVIQELMGHSRLNSTQVYTRVSKVKLVDTFLRCHPRGRVERE